MEPKRELPKEEKIPTFEPTYNYKPTGLIHTPRLNTLESYAYTPTTYTRTTNAQRQGPLERLQLAKPALKQKTPKRITGVANTPYERTQRPEPRKLETRKAIENSQKPVSTPVKGTKEHMAETEALIATGQWLHENTMKSFAARRKESGGTFPDDFERREITLWNKKLARLRGGKR
ncbi:hypothetical protein P280DRAFT_264083 [Massarina eburnea CBS 473.64]|uniref:Uncharacterized protein n=1 Tax=Massarina eburnea CBS 473.64 TaxID=1395130 RepID=A0A6A6S513_9PLEO|nr:hypothetical protein P280DRAFT_264083 [Massarina eburnea CBS 473.64]